VLSAEALMELSLFVFVLVLAYANGTNDVSKAIATLVGSGVANYRSTVLWGAIWTTVGAAASGVVAGAMLNTFSTGLLQPGVAAPPALAGAVLIGAIAWVLCGVAHGAASLHDPRPDRRARRWGLVAFGSDGLAWPTITQKSRCLAAEPGFGPVPLFRAVSGDAGHRGSLGRRLPLRDAGLPCLGER